MLDLSEFIVACWMLRVVYSLVSMPELLVSSGWPAHYACECGYLKVNCDAMLQTRFVKFMRYPSMSLKRSAFTCEYSGGSMICDHTLWSCRSIAAVSVTCQRSKGSLPYGNKPKPYLLCVSCLSRDLVWIFSGQLTSPSVFVAECVHHV